MSHDQNNILKQGRMSSFNNQGKVQLGKRNITRDIAAQP